VKGADSTGISSSTFTISQSSYDTTELLGGASCLTDLPVTVLGRSITLPISVVCPYLGYLGTILVALAWIAAARITLGGITGG
jgi:hypothetical protein